MAEAICCPFCNSLFARDQATPSARGACCPRCGELLPAAAPAGGSAQHITAAPPLLNDRQTQRTRARGSNLIVGAVVLLLMGAMAAVGLTLALWTKNDRRRNDFRSPPGAWTGIGYLPEHCNIICKLQVADLLKDSEAGKLLAEPRPPYVDLVLNLLENWSGLTLDKIDYAVLGVVLESQQANLVVVTNKPYDPADLVKKLRAEHIGEHHSMPVYSFNGGMRLWCPEQYIFVVAMSLKEFKKGAHDEFPFPPRTELRGQRAEVQAILESNRVQKSSLFWVVGDGDWMKAADADNIKILLALSAQKKDKKTQQPSDLEQLAGIKSFAVSVDRDLVLHGSFSCRDQETAQWLQKYLAGLKRDDVPLKVVATPPEVAPPEVQVQAGFTADQLRSILTELAPRKGK